MSAQREYQPDTPPDEHMQGLLESLSTLKRCFSEDDNVVKAIEWESHLANAWIAEAEPLEQKVSPRALGAMEPAEKRRGNRSIFDDIADDVD